MKYVPSIDYDNLTNSLNDTILEVLKEYTKIVVTKNSMQYKNGWYFISLRSFLTNTIEENIEKIKMLKI